MLTIEIGYRKALPIRAIQFCSHGSLNALSVAAFLANPESIPGEFDERTHEDSDHPMTKYGRPPTSFRVDEIGNIERLPPGIFHSIPDAVEVAMDSDDPINPIKALPPGVFVWLDEIKVLFDYLDFQYTRQEDNARGFIEHFREWRDTPLLPMDEATAGIVLEGVDQAVQTAKKGNVKRSAPGGIDPVIQRLADAESIRVHKLTGRYPKKETLAAFIEAKTGRKANTVMREFRSLKAHK